MKIYKTQQEVENDVKDGVLAIEGDVKFECSVSIRASIFVTAGNITAGNITAGNITAWDINADVPSGDVPSGDVPSGYKY
jgi:hypothetical protein